MITSRHSLYSLTAFCLLMAGCSQPQQPIQPQGKVAIDFTCRMADGALVETTLAPLAGNETIVKSPIFSLRDKYRPFLYQVPEQSKPLELASYDPLEQKIVKSIINRIGELRMNQTTTLQLANEEVTNFLPRDRFVTMARHFILPRMVSVSTDEFTARYGTTPRTAGTKVDEGTEFSGVIRGVNETEVTVYYSVGKDATAPTILGPAAVREKDADNFEATIDAQMGQLVQRVGGLPGRVSAVDKEQFTIDFGQSFAGETLSCEVTTQPAQSDEASKVSAAHWIEDYEQGLSQARRLNKPVLLLLTDTNCTDCQTMENKLLRDTSLGELRDRFVLVKANGKQQEALAKRFGRQGYPLTLILDGMGKELVRMSGVQHITAIAYRLEQVSTKGNKG